MLEEHDLKALSDAVSEAWNNVKLTPVNGLDVRLRIVSDKAADFHSHADSDELFCCLEGAAFLDVEDGSSVALQPHQLTVVPRNARHRLRVEGRAVILVIDAITG